MIKIADLNERLGGTLNFDGAAWFRILEILRPLKVLDEATLDRMIRPSGRIEVTEQQAQAIGKCLDRWVCRDLERQHRELPTIPSYIRPISTSNGLWIDPALPLLNRRQELPGDLILFVVFCLSCKGFAVN